MAKISTIAKNNKKIKMVARQAAKRAELRSKRVDPSLSDAEREEARKKLQSLPQNGCAVRVRNRCILTGRSRGTLRKFGLSRIKFRELALKGFLPGVTKSSW